MKIFPRPRIVVSACLEFEKVRYDGKVIPCGIVRDLQKYADFIKVCPEYEIGLGVPRDTIRIVKAGAGERLVQPKTGKDVTEDMDAFTDRFLDSLPGVDGFIFKSRSPTIGLKDIRIYKGPHDPNVVGKTSGFFARKILDRYYGYPIEEDDRLRNSKIKHHFLTALFTFAGLRSVKESGSHEMLGEFLKKNRYLIKLYNPGLYKKMIEMYENNRPIADQYEALRHVFETMPSREDYVVISKEIFDEYSGRTTDKERTWFNDALDKYEKNKIDLNGLLEVLLYFATGFEDRDMLEQSLFEPYPLDLMPDIDVNRDRDYAIVKH